MRQFEDMFRPTYELWAVGGWLSGAALLLLIRPPFWYFAIPLFLSLFLMRSFQVFRLWKFRLSISAFRVAKKTSEEIKKLSQDMLKQKQSLWLGTGFRWGQREAEIAQQILIRNVDEVGDIPLVVKRAIEKITSVPPNKRTPVQKAVMVCVNNIMPKDSTVVADSAIGVPWIHGIGEKEENIPLHLGCLSGHTLILGTTRAGKTRLYDLLCSQVIHLGSCLIVIDPKKDKDLVARMRIECKAAGRKFLYFDAARPKESIRIDPLASWNNISEPATRIGQLVDADGSFAAFAWKTLSRVQRALVAAGEKPNIRNTKHYVTMGVEGLCEKILELFFRRELGPDWDRDLPKIQPGATTGSSGGKGPPTRLDLIIQKYVSGGYTDDAVNGLVSIVKHSKEHYSKMVQVLEPILEMLGSDEIGALLSPDPSDITDTRPIYDIRQIIDEKAVLYVGLDALSNKIIASAIGSILLADMASAAGSIYNFSQPADVYCLIDEAAEVANDQLTQLLNKAGGAGFKMFLAAQSIADFNVRYQSKDKAEQVLANLNNLICLRLRSRESAQYVSDMFGNTQTRQVETGFSTGSESSALFTEFRSNVSKSLKSTEAPLVTPDLIMRLPPLQFFCFISGQFIGKVRIPFIS